MAKMNTKDRKLKIKDTVYVFRVPAETSLDPVDIIKAGQVLMIKEGMKPTVDVYGKILGKFAGGWNPLKPIEVDPAGYFPPLQSQIFEAIQRTKRQLEAEEKYPEDKLYRLSVTKHRGQPIEREDEPAPRYFFRTVAYCDNCHELIPGTQTLEVNKNGKVAKEFSFVPDDKTVVQKNGSKKWLHKDCTAKSVVEEPPIGKDSDSWRVKLAGEKEPPTNSSMTLEEVMEILEDPMIHAEFRCGAAWMYLKLKGGLS